MGLPDRTLVEGLLLRLLLVLRIVGACWHLLLLLLLLWLPVPYIVWGALPVLLKGLLLALDCRKENRFF